MFSSKEAELSSDELRKKLYQTFKNKGVLDTLKAQLRHQLIKELNSNVTGSSEAVPRLVPVKFDPFLVSACNAIVADHLHTSGYEYTLSVFYPESGISNDKALKKEELFQFLRISPESALHSSLSSNKETDEGFLINLLTQLTHLFTPSVCHDVETQTTSTPSYGDSLVEKMKRIDKEYENVCSSREKMFSSQTHLATYRKEIQAQLEAEINTKIQHFKDVEIAKVRMEEKSKYHQEFDKLKQGLEQTYEMKAKALMDREKNAIDRLQRQQENEEKNVYMQRQSLLKEIEMQRNRENELRKRTEEFEKTCQIHEEKVKTMDDLLRRRELAVKTTEDTADQQLKNQLSRFQLELKEDYIKRTEKLTECETKNKLESARLQKEAAVIDAGLEEHSRACSELKQLKTELDTAQQQISLLNHQKTMLNERLETFSDYHSLTRERAELQGRLQLLHKELEDAQGEGRILREAMTKPSSEQLALQLELRRLQYARKQDQEEFDYQKQVLQAQLQSEVEQNDLLNAHLKEREKKLDSMNKYVEDIKAQLRQTQQALDNEVLQNPKPSLSERSGLELKADKWLSYNIHANRTVKRTRLGLHNASEAGAQMEGSKTFWRNNVDRLGKAKARMMELQREADNLEKSYRDYQQEAVVTTISHKLPAKALSPDQGRPSLHHPESFFKKQDAQNSYTHTTEKAGRSFSPLTVGSPSFTSVENRNLLPPSQLKVSFSEVLKPPNTVVSSDHNLQLYNQPFFHDKQSQNDMFSPESSLSMSHSALKTKLQTEVEEEVVLSPVALPRMSFDRHAPPAPHHNMVTSGEFSTELSSPPIPQRRSTSRSQSSSPKLQPVYSSSESYSQPEKISIQDITEFLSEPGRIPQLLLDTATSLTEEAPNRPAAPQQQDATGHSLDLQEQAEAPHTADDARRDEGKEEEDALQPWKRETKERLENRPREQDEVREIELQEMEQLDKEVVVALTDVGLEEPSRACSELEEQQKVFQKCIQSEEEEDEVNNDKQQEEEDPISANPIEKYMKMLIEAREKQSVKSPETQEAGHTSPDIKDPFEETDDRIAAFSNKEEDDDFW